MKRIISVILLGVILVLSACSSMSSFGLSKGEEAAIIAAKEIEKVILNPGQMKIMKIYYKEGEDADGEKNERIRMTVDGISRGGAPVITEFFVIILANGESLVSSKFTDLEIFVAGSEGVFMTALNELNFGIDETDLEKHWEKIDAEKINNKFRK